MRTVSDGVPVGTLEVCRSLEAIIHLFNFRPLRVDVSGMLDSGSFQKGHLAFQQHMLQYD